MPNQIQDLFASDIRRRIEEVIKVDQTDEQIIREEIGEYVVTDSLRSHFEEILDRYRETPNKPHEGIAVWISGFFGSGKSSFAKMLGLALDNRAIVGEGAAQLVGQRTGDKKVQSLLQNIVAQIPSDSVIFDVSTDRGIRTGNKTLTEIMYRLFMQSLGYAADLDLSELEITLEADDRLEEFKQKYRELFKGKEWDHQKGLVALAIQQASRVMHALEPSTFATVDSWRESAHGRADISPGLLAERCKHLMARRSDARNLVFVVDEVGQFVARDVQKMLDLQAIVQNLGRVGRGKMWIVVTSQEKLDELVGGLDDKRVELARLQDRFPLRVHLAPSDISEVTSKRVLSKDAAAQAALRDLFTQHRGRLTDNTRLTADIKLPELTTESFIDLYPLLPYQVTLIIQIVSGLRTQGGASKHVGGANRTIIKLAQQLLIHPEVDLAGQPVGALARIDQIYDLVSGNIGSEVRGKIDAIRDEVDHPMAQPVAKAICLLQYVKSIHRTAENIAAALHAGVDADSRLHEVRAALQKLEEAHQVRQGEDGYRIPSPAEDDWDRQRSSLAPKPADSMRLHREVLQRLWQPQPSHSFLGTKLFKAGLWDEGRMEIAGDIPVHVTVAEPGADFDEQSAEMRTRSQTERKAIFWTMPVGASIQRETDELFRSREILSRKERGAQTKDETALVAEEKIRQRRHQDELRRLLRQASLSGSIYFRGNDRSPDDTATDVRRTVEGVLAQALPEVFDRFAEAAARVQKKDLDSLLTTENLRGLSPVFTQLQLVQDQGGQPVFAVDTDPLKEVLSKINDRTSYGDVANGKYLADEFGKEPFGWDFDVVRLLVICLLRAGRVEATSKGQVIESALSLNARNTFPNNNLFRQASFQPKTSDCAYTDYLDANENFKEVFGREISELEESVVAATLCEELGNNEEQLRSMQTALVSHGLPGADVLGDGYDKMRAIAKARDCQAIKTFNASFKELKEAIKRAAELEAVLTEPALVDLDRAQTVLGSRWPFLDGEHDLDEGIRGYAAQLEDLMQRETFFRELPAIDQHSRDLEKEYGRRYELAVQDRAMVYGQALSTVRGHPAWTDLNDEQRERVSASLIDRTGTELEPQPDIPLLRAHSDACQSLLNKAIEEMMRMVDGNRVTTVNAGSYFSGGVESEEQLDAALEGLREECAAQIGAGKKVLVQ